MKILSRVFRFIFSVYGFASFVVIMLLLFPLVILASFLGKKRAGNIIYSICRFWADLNMLLWLMWHRNIYETPHDRSKQYVFVFNHISYIDIPVILKSIRRQSFRILGKAEMGKVPIFGFFYRNAVVMVDRSNAEKRARSISELKQVIHHGISVVIAPEGTFNTTHHPLKEFYDGAFRIAIETQTPIKPILFLHTYDRLSYENIFSLNPGPTKAVYLEEIPVDGLELKDVAYLKERTYKLMEEKLVAYKASWIK